MHLGVVLALRLQAGRVARDAAPVVALEDEEGPLDRRRVGAGTGWPAVLSAVPSAQPVGPETAERREGLGLGSSEPSTAVVGLEVPDGAVPAVNGQPSHRWVQRDVALPAGSRVQVPRVVLLVEVVADFEGGWMSRGQRREQR